MPADWFFDPSATGTGSGDTPSDAITDVWSWHRHIAFFANSFSWGDRIWARRSAVAAWGSDSNASLWIGKSGWLSSSPEFTWFIGWPKSGDPFYNDRPSAAISAGWDSDVNTVYPDINMFTISYVVSYLVGVKDGFGMANILYTSPPDNPNRVARSRIASSYFVPKWNWHILNQYPENCNLGFRDLTWTFSSQTVPLAVANVHNINKLTLSQSCFIGSAIFGHNTDFEIAELVIETNSAYALGTATSVFNPTQTNRRIGTLRGVPFKSEVSSITNLYFCNRIVVDDWFGEGPRVISGKRILNTKLPSAAVAQVNSERIIAELKTSGDQGMAIAGRYNSMRTQNSVHRGQADARILINYDNGLPLIVRWPLYISGEADILSPNLLHYFHLRGGGGGMIEARIEPSSGFTWTGNSVGVGSAYVAVGGWMPTASGSGFLDFSLSPWNVGSSDFIFLGKPEVNSQ